jgi:hypothetical protein
METKEVWREYAMRALEATGVNLEQSKYIWTAEWAGRVADNMLAAENERWPGSHVIPVVPKKEKSPQGGFPGGSGYQGNRPTY